MAFNEYIQHGWYLVPVPTGQKTPSVKGWNKAENCASLSNPLEITGGAGIAHAYSGTMALDIDNMEDAVNMLSTVGVDLNALINAPDAVGIKSGKKGHGKLLYKMPMGAAVPSRKISNNKGVVYELRCGTSSGLTVQDILPPSVHPETGQSYEWVCSGHWSRLPEIPESLLTHWLSLQDTQDTLPTTNAPVVDIEWQDVRNAVMSIPSDCTRDEWVSVGMALHLHSTQLGQPAFGYEIWDSWSKQSTTKYPGSAEMLHQWKSFNVTKSNKVKVGTIYRIAAQHGYVKPVNIDGLFSNTATLSPVDLLDGLKPKAPEMDISMWPEMLATRAMEVSDGVGCDPIVPLFAGMAAVCAAIDARSRLQLMPGFKVPPVLWLMTLGAPADKKSPGSRPMLTVLRSIEADDKARFAQEMLQYEGREAAYASAKKAYLEWSGSPEAMIPGSQAPVLPELPTQPTPVKITVSDVTSQKLVRIASDRPRGLLCYLDEMYAWTTKMIDKGNGEDRSAWVSAYEAERYEMDRVGSGSIHAENLAVSIYGNIQPGVFRTAVVPLSADGLLQRFIPAILRPGQTRLGNPKNDDQTSAEHWDNTIRLIYSLPEQTYTLTAEAYLQYREFQKWYEAAKQDERLLNSGTEFMTAFGKLEGLVGRIALIWHVLDNPFCNAVSAQTIDNVISFVKGYVIPAYRYALSEIAGIAGNEFDTWLVDYIVQNASEVDMVSLRGLKRSARRPLEGMTDWRKEQAIQDAMYNLEQAGWVAKVTDDGQKHHVEWVINPQLSTLYAGYRQSVIDAKQRHLDYVYRHAIAKGHDRPVVKNLSR